MPSPEVCSFMIFSCELWVPNVPDRSFFIECYFVDGLKVVYDDEECLPHDFSWEVLPEFCSVVLSAVFFNCFLHHKDCV